MLSRYICVVFVLFPRSLKAVEVCAHIELLMRTRKGDLYLVVVLMFLVLAHENLTIRSGCNKSFPRLKNRKKLDTLDL